MLIRSILKYKMVAFTVVVVVPSFLGLYLWTNSPESSNGQGQILALKKSKSQILGKISPTALKHTTKVRGSLTLEIERADNGPDSLNPGDEFTLKAIIQTHQPLDQATLTWSVPETVEVISGSLIEQLEDLDPKESQVIELRLKSLSEENEQIHAKVQTQSGSIQFTESAQYNTTLQREIIESKAALMKRTEEYLIRTKVYQ